MIWQKTNGPSRNQLLLHIPDWHRLHTQSSLEDKRRNVWREAGELDYVREMAGHIASVWIIIKPIEIIETTSMRSGC